MSRGLKQNVQEKYDKNLSLIRRYREGDELAGEELVILNKPLVCSIAARYTSRGVELEDLVATGNIGLVKAMNTFDFSRECAFSTYAVPLIFGEIRRFLRDDGMIKVSREQKRLSAILGAERERRLTYGEPTDIASIAAAVGVSSAEAAAAIFSASPVRSLEESTGEDDTRTLADTVFDDDAEGREFESLALRMALDKLCDDERKLIMLRFFRDLPQIEVARIMGISQVKVSREEKKILARLKRDLA